MLSVRGLILVTGHKIQVQVHVQHVSTCVYMINLATCASYF